MNWTGIQNALKDEPAYRVAQVKKALFVDLVASWEEVTVLPKTLREALSRDCPLDVSADVLVSKDDATEKAVLTLHDGLKIESVLMRHKDGRNTVCVSSLVGCPMGCTFCATASMGLVRKLTANEIVLQVLFFARRLKKDEARVSSVVFMGMGEPFLNYEAVMEAVRVIHDPDTFNIGARHISISTCGLLDGIKKLAQEALPVNLAISLHASNDEVRRTLMPVARTYAIEELMDVVRDYIQTTKRKVMFEYLLVKDLNDSAKDAEALAKLLRGMLCMVNLISYNSTGKYTATSEKGVTRFRDILRRRGVEASIRYRFGRDIEGACGQLVVGQTNGEI